ncbi:hypothetical protein BST41_25575 [Mycolicibacterium porcinum]|nr:hypothetical protein BST41_25575 [Mycolicibacterium porcinum]
MPAGVLSAFLCWNAISAIPVAQANPGFGDPTVPPLVPGQVLRIGPSAGTGTPTRDYGIGATDLCEFMEFPSRVLQVCGDSFAGQAVGFGGWHSPVALHVDADSIEDAGGVRYRGVTGVDKPLLADPTPAGASQLPAGVISINRENYMMVTTTKDLRPQSSRLVKADAARPNWPTVPGSVREAKYQGGAQSQITGYYDPVPAPDSPGGWVYILANNFDRSSPPFLYRAGPKTFTDRATWQGWSSSGGWGKPPTALFADRVGEMSIRQIDGKPVLSYFNATNGNMEVRVAYDPTGLGTAPVTTVVFASEWPDPVDALPPPEVNQLAQPYGGYISPGSTLDQVRVFISQWNTMARGGTPYRVIQYAVNPFKPWEQ